MIADALTALRVTSLTIDGEGVVCGPDGVSDFERLRAAVGRKGSRDAFLYAFDLLELDGQDLRREPWEIRRDALASLLRKAGPTAPGIRLRSISTAPTAKSCSAMPASSGWRASSPSGGIGRIDQGALRNG